MSPKSRPSPLPYLAAPPSGSGPGVLLIHAWWGLNSFFKQTCDRLAAVRGSSIGLVGFSMGAHWALWLAAQRPALPLGAVVAFYGARAGDFSGSRAAYQGHFAEHDKWVSDASLKKLNKNLQAAGRPTELFVYPGTSHWFFESDRDDAYNPQAAELAWTRTIDLLRKQLA